MLDIVCRNLTRDWYDQWSSSLPDIPLCFQFFDAPIYLLVYQILCTPYIIRLAKKKTPKRPLLKLTLIKLVLILCLIGLQFLEIVVNIVKMSLDSTVYLISNCCFIVCLSLAGVTVLLEMRCNAINSGFYFNYWLLHALIYFVRARTAGLDLKSKAYNSDYSRECFIFINYSLVTLSLILSCFSEKMTDKDIKRHSKNKNASKILKVDAETNHVSEKLELNRKIIEEEDKEENGEVNQENGKNEETFLECPEFYSSYLSRIVFFWFTPMVLKGYRRSLKESDLWKLNPRDYSDYIVPILTKNLQRYIVLDESERLAKPTSGNDETNNCNARPPNIEDQEKEKLTGSNAQDNGTNHKEPGTTSKTSTKFDPCLFYALVRSHWVDLLVSAIYKLIHDILTYSGPIFLKMLLQFVANPEGLFWKGYFIVILMLITAMVRTFILHQYFHLVFKIGMRVRSSLISMVYRKSLVLSTSSRKDSTVGEIVNLMSIDSQKFLELISYIHMIWSGPFQIIVALIFLWFELGPSVLAGLAVMLLMIPINAIIGNVTRKIQTKQLKVADMRIKMMNEILNGIKVLKLYAWEPSYMSFVSDIRNKELNFMRQGAYLHAAISFTFNCAPFLVSLTSFGMFVLVSRDNILDAEKAFVSISLFNILRFPLMMLPMVISNLIQATVSLKRLTTFLKRNEIDPLAVSHDDTTGISAIIENGEFSWDPKSQTPTLQNINIVFPERQLVAIVGPVGAGKSSILGALLGEIDKIEGRVNRKGTVAYVPQQAWIINATIRDNILFGLPYVACKYQKVIKACCLERDFEIMRDSDFTEIGEKGINLSGGQKQRISLARACYSDSDLFLFDDPLSAVDSHVSKDLIDNVFGSSGMLNRCTRILVTHNITLLPKCDRIIVLDNGVVSEQGSYSELIKHAGPFANFIATHIADELKTKDKNNFDTDELLEKDMMLQELQRSYSENNQSNSTLFSSFSKSRQQIYKSMENLKKDHDQTVLEDKDIEKELNCKHELEKMGIKEERTDGDKLIEDELSKEGNVKLAVYMAYLRSIGFFLAGGILSLFIITQVFSLISNLWLVRWSNQAKISSNFSRNLSDLKRSQNPDQTMISEITDYLTRDRNLNLGIYGLLGVCQVFFQLLSSVTFAYATVRSASGLHKNLLRSIMRSPMNTFETIPIGRIINRFSSDLNSVGTMLPHFINGFLLTSLSAIVVLVMVILPNPWIIIPLTFIVICYMLIQRFYVKTSRQLKRLESVSKSPIYSHFGETLQGVSSIRAYSLCDRFIQSSDQKVDKNLYAYYANIVSNRWLAILLETIGNCIVFMASLFAVVSVHKSLGINAGLVGLSVSYALSITQTLNWLVRMSSEVESNIVAVERIEEYSQMTPEAPWEIQEKKPEDAWPSGSIKFVNYSTRYREGLDLVLKNINFTVNPREKVGIVGRTGSGKSSLVLALFRILERSDGEILIDDIPIHELGLHDVRGRLTIIPQEPVLFSGTLRRNLDPFSKYRDDEIWKVLEMSNLQQFVVNSGSEQLEMAISEGGENLSVGQRQLVCLARALLRRTNVFVLDEATAAVDLDTDVLLQETIRREFKDCTILTIAHRLNTVLDYDRIMVLDQGCVIEMDSPQNLLKNSDSHFYSMVKSANLI